MDDGDGNEGGEDDDGGRWYGKVTRVVGARFAGASYVCECGKGSTEEKSRQRPISISIFSIKLFTAQVSTRDSGEAPDAPMITNTGSRNFLRSFK